MERRDYHRDEYVQPRLRVACDYIHLIIVVPGEADGSEPSLSLENRGLASIIPPPLHHYHCKSCCNYLHHHQ